MDPSIPPHPAEAYFRSTYIWPDEKILWSGGPGRVRSMRFNWWFCIIGCFLCLFLFRLWLATPEISDVRLPEALFVLFSVWLAVTPLRYYWKASRTAYFITDKRAVILEKGFRVRETVFHPADITDYQVTRRAGDRGDIRLRISKRRTKTAYEEDREKWIRGPKGNLSWVGSPTFVSYLDGFWDVEHIPIADAALKELIGNETDTRAPSHRQI